MVGSINNKNVYISPITVRELVKWLSYTPDFKQREIEKINSKRIDELSCEELEEVLDNKKQERMLNLLARVYSENISDDELEEVNEYIDNESIEDLMKSKLSENELEEAMYKIKGFCYISDEDIIRKIEEERQEKKYNKMSMVDSYVFHIMSGVYHIIEMKKTDRQIYDCYSDENSKVLSYK